MNYKKILISCFIILVLLLLTGCTTNNTDNGSDDQNWLTNYSPSHSVGTGSSDFWINYPEGNPSSGQTVEHLSWVIDSIERDFVLFVVHKDCSGCRPQTYRVVNLAEKYKQQVEFHDLNITHGGITEQKAYDAYLYDPDGPPGYIALTGVFTYIKDNGDVKIGWHAWEGNVEDSEMESWIKDAIYYYTVNSEG